MRISKQQESDGKNRDQSADQIHRRYIPYTGRFRSCRRRPRRSGGGSSIGSVAKSIQRGAGCGDTGAVDAE